MAENTEHQEQTWFCKIMDNYHPDILYFAIPNGGRRDHSTAARLKREGVKPGIPDIFIAEPRSLYPGLFVELKKKKGGKISKAQIKMIDKLHDRGYAVHVANGGQEAYKLVCEYLGVTCKYLDN